MTRCYAEQWRFPRTDLVPPAAIHLQGESVAQHPDGVVDGEAGAGDWRRLALLLRVGSVTAPRQTHHQRGGG